MGRPVQQESNLHPLLKTLVALVGLALTAWEAIGRTGDPRFPLLILYVIMMGLVSPQVLERVVDRIYPGQADTVGQVPPTPPAPEPAPEDTQNPPADEEAMT